MPLLEVQNISFQERNHTVLEDISFTQQEFQKLVIAGETGSGKSTLLQIIAGLVQPNAGEVFFDGTRVRGPQEVLVPGQAGIAYLSQHFELPQFLRVEQVLKYANTFAENDAENLYELCRIGHLLKRKTSELSGGERQRIALAKLLLGAPKLLLLDEPFSNLDNGHKKLLKTVLHDIGEELKITSLLVSHDPLDTLSWADKILVLENGQIVQRGTPQEIYRRPVNQYTAGLFGSYNLIPPPLAFGFEAMLRIALSEKSLLIRPECIKIKDAAENGIPGTINRVQFFGSYSEVEVQLAGIPVIVKTVGFKGKKGEKVCITVAAEDVWYV
ncbi:ABC transporter ATP-binding protein [Adhaeribacter sp. BT258]|uniref:ABC transporter ATP-binding protein n=1 Tax=Adhaeribacter terrigena TaxID=2793070 RepID=A0ABS1BWY2_9BACT|nr:ABC transporter ATP-binding protein [Adhaeribacter terrigena]MBK0401651.1 ABC transporter ATP-binding protein [Adhaeribacter terrigena]